MKSSNSVRFVILIFSKKNRVIKNKKTPKKRFGSIKQILVGSTTEFHYYTDTKMFCCPNTIFW